MSWELRDEAVGTLANWIDGYSDPGEDDIQRRIRIQDDGEGFLDVSVEPMDDSRQVTYHRITITVTDLPAPAEAEPGDREGSAVGELADFDPGTGRSSLDDWK